MDWLECNDSKKVRTADACLLVNVEAQSFNRFVLVSVLLLKNPATADFLLESIGCVFHNVLLVFDWFLLVFRQLRFALTITTMQRKTSFASTFLKKLKKNNNL